MGGGDSLQTLASIAGNGKIGPKLQSAFETQALTIFKILTVYQCWSGMTSVRIVGP